MTEAPVFRQDAGYPSRSAAAHEGSGARVAFASSVCAVTRPDSLEAEAYRGLRTQLFAQHLNLGRRAVAICAAAAGDGSSLVATNLAVVLAQAGINTVLVDANVEHPQLEFLIRPPADPPGLAECLQSDVPPADCIFGPVIPNLSVIYGGRGGRSSTELLAGPRFKSLIEFCLMNFDAAIIDTPAANRSHAAQEISSLVGYSIVVARKDRTFVKDVKTLIRQLGSGGVGVVGTVLCGA
jgi:Mrp family chromosome partitioning ATPase